MSTTIAALSANAIRYVEFVKLSNSSFTDTFCNAPDNITVGGVTYAGMGSYMGVSEIQSDMKATSTDVKLTISGLNPANIALVLGANIKGSTLTIWRGFTDSDNQLLTIGGVLQFFQRYQGIINNINITENFDEKLRERVATCIMSSASMRLVLDSRIAGIKTNPSSWRFLYPNDTSMDRVPAIASTYFNFGNTASTGSTSKVIGSTSTVPAQIVKFGN